MLPNDVMVRRAVEMMSDVFGDHTPAIVHGFVGGFMRCHDHVVQLVEGSGGWMAGLIVGRVGPPNIESRATDAPLGQCGVECSFIDDRTATDIDDEGRCFHEGELSGADQINRARGAGDCDDHKVRRRQVHRQFSQRAKRREVEIGSVFR